MSAPLRLSHALLIFVIPGFLSSCVQRGNSAQVPDSASSRAGRAADASGAAGEFQKRVKAYAELERKLESQLPKLPKEGAPEGIVAHKLALAEAIQRARSDAKQGDLFTPEVRPILIGIVRSETVGSKGAETRQEIAETAAKKSSNEAPAPVNLKVNSPYPSNASLSTVPPDLLTKLPRLPEEVDYRFVRNHLILRSVKGNLILDVLPGALPPPATKKQK